jgi:hypothetical protein
MGVLNIVGSSLVSQAEFDAKDLAAKLAANAAGQVQPDIQLSNTAVVPLSQPRLQPVFTGSDDMTPLPPIAFGKALTVDIRYAYSGRVGMNNGDIAVVSGVRNWSVTTGTSRALNFLVKNKGKHTGMSGPDVFGDGTNIVCYQKAVTSRRVTVGLEMAAAKKDSDFLPALSSAFTAAGRIPLFLPYSGALLAAGQLVPLVGKLLDALSGKTEPWTIAEAINFNLPGTAPTAAQIMLVAQNEDVFVNYKIAADGKLVDHAGKAYAGDEPYIILAVYGGADPSLEEFTPALVGADFMKRFFQAKEGVSAALGNFTEIMKVVSDYKYREDADDFKQRMAEADATPEELAELKARYDAAIKNIVNPVMKPAA